jgi:asparagine synthase (glutamine-hydrolysing)
MFPVWLNEEFSARCACRDRWEARYRPSWSPHPVRPRGYDAFCAVQWQQLFEDCDITGALSHAEIRHPFLDLPLLQYMLALPAMPWCRNKLIIRRSMRTALPGDVLRRKKVAVQVSPDFQRVLASGFPRLVPSRDLLGYVNPGNVLSTPRSSLELRGLLRPLALNTWLLGLAHMTKGDPDEATRRAHFQGTIEPAARTQGVS